jgi:hypothetical protein
MLHVPYRRKASLIKRLLVNRRGRFRLQQMQRRWQRLILLAQAKDRQQRYRRWLAQCAENC